MTQRTLVLVDLMYQGRDLERVICQQDWHIAECHTTQSANESIKQHRPDLGLMVIDKTITTDQLKELRECLEKHRSLFWQMIISPGLENVPEIRELILMYCSDYHTLPISHERLILILGHTAGMADLCNAPDTDSESSTEEDDFPFVGESKAVQLLKARIERIANTDATVLICGESGTGKELVAKSIHRKSTRCDKPLIALNCGAFPDNLIQSELFGHEKGAFTGAVQRKIGRVEQADDGTLFLDEVGDLPLSQQVCFLRFLQEGTIERVGGNRTIDVNARVIAATHVDLERAIQAGKFREDFYYRLNVAPIVIPPLRERPEDILLLAHFFLERYASRYHSRVCGFTKAAVLAMKGHPWPGNVRELTNRVCRAVMFSEGRLLSDADLGIGKCADRLSSLAHARDAAEKETIQKTLSRFGNNISEAARHLRVSRLTLYRLMDKHDIKDTKRLNEPGTGCAV